MSLVSPDSESVPKLLMPPRMPPLSCAPSAALPVKGEAGQDDHAVVVADAAAGLRTVVGDAAVSDGQGAALFGDAAASDVGSIVRDVRGRLNRDRSRVAQPAAIGRVVTADHAPILQRQVRAREVRNGAVAHATALKPPSHPWP